MTGEKEIKHRIPEIGFIKRMYYVNATKKEFVFEGGFFLNAEHIPLDYLKLTQKDYFIVPDGIYFQNKIIGTIQGRTITWTSNKVFD